MRDKMYEYQYKMYRVRRVPRLESVIIMSLLSRISSQPLQINFINSSLGHEKEAKEFIRKGDTLALIVEISKRLRHDYFNGDNHGRFNTISHVLFHQLIVFQSKPATECHTCIQTSSATLPHKANQRVT